MKYRSASSTITNKPQQALLPNHPGWNFVEYLPLFLMQSLPQNSFDGIGSEPWCDLHETGAFENEFVEAMELVNSLQIII